MGFTVTQQGGTKDVEFEAYARLLRQQGVDLARLPRVPEPGTGRRWLYAWDSAEEARAFADELIRRTRDPAWQVVEVSAPVSEGPLGPVEIQVGRQNNGWTFALHPLSRLMVQKVFPGSCRTPSVFIAAETRPDDAAAHRDLADFAEPVAILLTGLSGAKLTEAFGGYRLYDPAARKELVASGPVQA
jgi:hypothetical protein